jgi:hypothetical protein
MEHWESYVLGAFGILVVVASIAGQIAALAAGDGILVSAFTAGVVGGALLYRAGYRLLGR